MLIGVTKTLQEMDKDIIIYQPDGNIRLEVRLNEETVWLTQQQMAELYGTLRQAITKHIKNIYASEELQKKSTCSILELVRQEGHRTVKRSVEFYNLDVIISVGYRVNTKQGILFRQWANRVLKEHLLRGYSVSHHLVAMQQQMDSRFSAIEQEVAKHGEQIEFLVRKQQDSTEKVFPAGCIFDAWHYISGLVRQAQQRIVLIDNYCDDRVLDLLAKRNRGVIVTIRSRYTSQFETDIEKHNKQYAPIEFVQLSQKNHDRFLIIDDTVFLLGTSVKDMGTSLCAITEMQVSADEILNLVK